MLNSGDLVNGILYKRLLACCLN